MLRPLAIAALALSAACASPLAEAESLFERGRYPEAKNAFVALEGESRRWNNERRARYALYRGMTHGALGDLRSAGVWLLEAKAIEDAHPGTLGREDYARLKLALEQIEGLRGAPSSLRDAP